MSFSPFAQSPAIRRNLSYILGLFSSQLEDEDSYMYLTAINGLAAMGDVYPTNIIPPLVAEFL